MTGNTVANAPLAPPTSKRHWLLYIIVLSALLTALGYWIFQQRQDALINHDYYRVLYEASNSFNQNLNKLSSLHTYRESESSIRSLLPSYQREPPLVNRDDILSVTVSGEFKYRINGMTLEVMRQRQYSTGTAPEANEADGELVGLTNNATGGKAKRISAIEPVASLAIEDILPQPELGFSQFLFTDGQGKVLANTGRETAISIVGLEGIAAAIQQQSKQFQFNFSAPDQQTNEPSTLSVVPPHSTHVDVTLSYGDFRVFIFPFPLTTPLTYQDDAPLETLYLVGLLPIEKLYQRGQGYWNVSVFAVTLISLVFIWTILRLFMLPPQQSITPLYRVFTVLASSVFFVTVLALFIAYSQSWQQKHHKKVRAAEYASQLQQRLKTDLAAVFNNLTLYRHFYHPLIDWLNTDPRHPPDPNAESLTRAREAYLSHDASQRFNDVIRRGIVDMTTDNQHNLCVPRVPRPVLSAIPGRLTELSVVNSTHHSPSLSFDFKRHEEATLMTAFAKNQSNLAIMDFYAGNYRFSFEQDGSVQTFVTPQQQAITPSNEPSDCSADVPSFPLLTVFALNTDGNSVLPSVYMQESNAVPSTFSLAHRDYYKQVRDQRGWQLRMENDLLPDTANHNLYIQRLLNINNGTRGTTVSMPMYGPGSASQIDPERGYVLGADVILPSMTLAPPAPLDMLHMVVNRHTGDVLFHSDMRRSLVENLYFSSHDVSAITHAIRGTQDVTSSARLSNLKATTLDGVYHGKPGQFMIRPTPVDQWALVIFYPDDSIDGFMTQLFSYIGVVLSASLVLIVVIIFLLRAVFNTQHLKQRLGMPLQSNGRLWGLITTVLLVWTMACFYVGIRLDLRDWDSQPVYFGPAFAIVGLLFALLIAYWGLKRYFSPFCSDGAGGVSRSARQLLLASSIFIAVILIHVSLTARLPYLQLAGYHQQQFCQRVNHERQELRNIALSRYPNTITRSQIDPLTLLPLEHVEGWREVLLGEEPLCKGYSQAAGPRDLSSLSTHIGTVASWRWIQQYVLGDFSSLTTANTVPLDSQSLRQGYPLTFSTQISFALTTLLVTALLCMAWLQFNRRVLWERLYCSDRFIAHIDGLVNSQQHVTHEHRSDRLVVDPGTIKRDGIGLNLLLFHLRQTDKCKELMPGFDQLARQIPVLMRAVGDGMQFPNLKISVDTADPEGLFNVELWDLETCLESETLRSTLFELIIELKSMTLSGRIHHFTLYTGFHSLHRINAKETLITGLPSLQQSEYLAWADCLMDFNVVVPKAMQSHIDPHIWQREIQHIPELHYLLNIATTHGNYQPQALGKEDRDEQLTRCWQTINVIRMHAEALYRFKWESCSNAEKLALYNLANGKRLNPANANMIEQLALNGLIRVHHGHLVLINQSFEQFVLNAEPPQTLDLLMRQSETGAWKSYRLPLGILILVVIGGIALTSGESIYIIAASVAGVLGTVASVTNSANLLRGQGRE
ncbi:hypothetical protein LJ739_06380 [Aestuariibacter halophilus]|uniref:Uncharacterized protein n=1 Tax=Fluctibacter halophilus TaxID=226011 RepID=A0ABS8G710_9ALTE|nr:hypothetical protein [Aestuariibacter halophilus]MCC2615861.1 hypothetical protein [Aestuariibacter halophilus]